MRLAGPLGQDRERVLLGLARVDHHREPGALGQAELGLERAPLVLSRRPVAEVVQARLADRPRLRVLRRALDLLQARGVEALGVVRVAADDRHHVLVLARIGQRLLDRLTVHAHRRQPGDARPPRPRHHVGGVVLARVEVAVGVDHPRLRRRRPRAARPWGRAGRGRRWSRRRHVLRTRRVERPVLAAERGEQLLGRLRDPRVQQHRHHAQPLGEGVQHRVELGPLRLVLRQLPGLRRPARSG